MVIVHLDYVQLRGYPNTGIRTGWCEVRIGWLHAPTVQGSSVIKLCLNVSNIPQLTNLVIYSETWLWGKPQHSSVLDSFRFNAGTKIYTKYIL